MKPRRVFILVECDSSATILALKKLYSRWSKGTSVRQVQVNVARKPRRKKGAWQD